METGSAVPHITVFLTITFQQGPKISKNEKVYPQITT